MNSISRVGINTRQAWTADEGPEFWCFVLFVVVVVVFWG